MTDELLDRFRAEAERASSRVLDLPHWEAVAEHAARQAAAEGDEGGRVVVAPSLATAVPGLEKALRAAGADVHVPDDDRPDVAAGVADSAVGIVRGELAIAESGSVLVSEHQLADRTVTMLCRRLIQVVERNQVVATLDDAAAWLAAHLAGTAGFASLMTGPSRTADIERSLTIGVQGPDVVDVVVLG